MALNLGDLAPDFGLVNVDGTVVRLSGFSDKKALAVIFSCNHCPYVLAWEDRLVEIQNDYADRGVQLVLINSNNSETHPTDSFENMQRHARDKNYSFPYLHDESQDVAHAYGGERTPHVFLFDQNRRLVYTGAPDDNYDDPALVKRHYLRSALDAVLAGRTPDPRQTQAQGCTIKWK